MATADNPFPGMNPFVLRSWNDVHISLTVYGSDSLNEKLPDGLLARVNEREFLTGSDEFPTKQRFLEILDATDGNRLVTMIEFLSESNKVPGKGRDLSLRKRDDCQEAGVNIVEIDFQRRGQATTMGHLFLSEDTNPPPYHASIWRATDPDIVECYPMPLREILPIIAIPLRAEDDDATLDLQELIDLAYRRGNYQAVAYRKRPHPPFGDEDEAWIDSVLAGRK